MDHLYHQEKPCFNGQEENREAPLSIICDYIIENGQKRMSFIENNGIIGSWYDPFKESGIKWFFILYKLAYLKDISIRHIVDIMHTKKNIAFAIIETFFGALDTISSHEDFWDLKIHQNLWVEKHDNEKYRKPYAPYVQTREQYVNYYS